MKSPRELQDELEAKMNATRKAALELRRMRMLKEARARARKPMDNTPVLSMGHAGAIRAARPEHGEWSGFEEHKRQMHALRQSEARAARRRRLEIAHRRQRKAALTSLRSGCYVSPTGVAELMLWAVGL